MRRIGIDQQLAEVYESAGNYWRIKLPAPLITGALLDPPFPANFEQGNPHVFREDDFDLTARVRRGRFYSPCNGQLPSPVLVLPRLAGDAVEGQFQKSLLVYDDYQLSPITGIPKLVALGSYGSVSMWRVALPPERISTGELLFVLKARHNFGILPELDTAAVPESGRAKVTETLAQLVDIAYRGSPSSIADRARDAAQWCLATWAKGRFSELSLFEDDLGKVIEKIERNLEKETGKRDTMVALKVTAVLQRFHSRGKPNEQERYGFRPPTEADAELALNTVAFLLRELGWARE
jgi:hypothetical protein